MDTDLLITLLNSLQCASGFPVYAGSPSGRAVGHSVAADYQSHRLQGTAFVMAKITILPANVSAEVADGENLIEAGESAGVEMEAGCFNCSCGTCAVEVVSGMENISEPTPEELDVLDQWNKDPEKFRLTCCNQILHGEVVLRAGH